MAAKKTGTHGQQVHMSNKILLNISGMKQDNGRNVENALSELIHTRDTRRSRIKGSGTRAGTSRLGDSQTLQWPSENV